MKGKEGTGDPGGPDAKSGRYSSGSGLCPPGEKCFFADAALAKNPKFHSRTKPISIQQHFIWEKVKADEVQRKYLLTEDMLAHLLTKALPREKVERFRNEIGIYEV